MPEQVRRYATGGASPGGVRGGGGGGGGGGGRRRPRGGGGGGGGGGGFDLSSILGGGGGGYGDMLGSLMDRYNQYADIGIAQEREDVPRRAKAFDYYSEGRESELEDAELRRDMARREARYGRERELRAGKESREAKLAADPQYGGESLEKNRQYLESLEKPFDALYTRYSGMRNLPAAGTMSGINFPSWNDTKR